MSVFLGTVTWNVDPVAISIGSLQVRWYGILLATGFVLAYITLQKIWRNENVSQKLLDRFAIWTIVWCVLGLRLCQCLVYSPEDYLTAAHWHEILLPVDENWNFIGYQGLASHGGAIAMLLWVIYFCYTRKMNFFWLLDRLCIAVPIAAAFVRCGNLMNHEIVGSITTVPWAFDFLRGGPGVAGTLRHPSQLYESLFYLSVFIGLVIYYFKFSKGNIAPGRTSGIMITAIFVFRFFIEFVKADQEAKEADMVINLGQQLSIPLILLGVGLIIYSIVKKDKIPHYIEQK